MNKTIKHSSRLSFIQNIFKSIPTTGYIIEFGVGEGVSLDLISNLTPRKIYGFDSFEGLPENWRFTPHIIFAKGSFKYDPPDIADNVELISGWFSDTISIWKENNKGPIAFLHIDSDLYSSCITILTELNEQIVPGTIILFDEIIGYPNWKDGEWKAFCEWKEINNRIAHSLGTNGTQVAYCIDA